MFFPRSTKWPYLNECSLLCKHQFGFEFYIHLSYVHEGVLTGFDNDFYIRNDNYWPIYLFIYLLIYLFIYSLFKAENKTDIVLEIDILQNKC